MFARSALAAVAVLGVALMFARPVLAADTTHEGKVVSVTEGKGTTDGKLVMSDSVDKNEHTHMISSTAKIMLNGKAAKLGDLKKGDGIKVTQDDKQHVVSVTATRK